MRFKEFLAEGAREFSLDSVISLIKIECQEWLHNTGDNFAYRGMKINSAEGYRFDHPKSRSPVDSSGSFNIMFNAGVDLAFGISNIREQSVFCTGSIDTTKEFGSAHMIFPRGDFGVLWSPIIHDSYVEEDQFANNFLRELDFDCTSDLFWQAFKELISFHGDGSIRDGVLRFLNNDELVEELFESDDSPKADDVRDALEKTFKKLYRDNHPDEAIKSRHEILLHKSDGYYAISVDAVKRIIQRNPSLDGQSVEEYISDLLFGRA